MIIVDSHEDIAWNIVTFGRDYSRSVLETRRLEEGSDTPKRNGQTLLGWPEWVKGRVGVVFATLFAAPVRRRVGRWETACYQDAEGAHRLYRAQLEAYDRLFDQHPDRFQRVTDRRELETVLGTWANEPAEDPRLGLVLLMEGADGIRQPSELEEWFNEGLRIIGPAWTGTRYSGGTSEPGPLTPAGRELLEVMADLGLILDLSHMAEEAVSQALDTFEGTLIASHSNCRALLDGSEKPDRHLTDEMIGGIAARDGVIGAVIYNRFLKGTWRSGDGREGITLEHVAAQIDHICQLVGDAKHIGLGSDFDGGFGLSRVPEGLDSVADLGLIGDRLAAWGYTPPEVEAIMGGNWLGVLRRALPPGN
jgi:membrane dipeptidase